jgi:hypothetical protein
MTRRNSFPFSLTLAALTLVGCGVQPTSQVTYRSVKPPAAAAVTIPYTSSQAANTDAMLTTGVISDSVSHVNRVNQQVTIVEMTVPTHSSGVEPGPSSLDAPPAPHAPGATFFAAGSGGHYVSADGKLSADIPPGVLSSDAWINIVPVDTSAQAANFERTPGVAFRVDLGGAYLNPDTQIIVRTEVDPRLVEAARAADANFDPNAFGLVATPSGHFQMQMPVSGPVSRAVRPTFNDVTGDGRALAEFGFLPVHANSNVHTYHTLAAADPAASRAAVSNTADCSNWREIIKADVPKSLQDLWDHEIDNPGNKPGLPQLYVCELIHNFDWAYRITGDLDTGAKPCTATPKAGVTATIGQLKIVEAPAQVTWNSDDKAFDGKPVPGAIVRYDGPWTPNTKADIVADAAGKATNFLLAGVTFQASAFLLSDPTPGKAVQALTKEGMAPVAVQITRMNPKVHLTVDSTDVAPEGKLSVNFTLDGKADTKTFDWPAGKKSANFDWAVSVTDLPAIHPLLLTNMTIGKASLVKTGLAPTALKINGSVDLKVMIANPTAVH